MPQRATLESVARRAQVSRQTVSNVLNAPDRVSAETRDRVQAAIDELGYRPSRAARQLRTRRSRTIALRIEPLRDGINGSVLDRFVHAFVQRAQADGYHVLVFTAPDDEAEIDAFEDLLTTADLDAFVVTGTHHGDPRTAWLAQRRVPFVTFGRPWGATGNTHPWVDVDGSAGTAQAVEHLAGLGRRRIGFLGWPAGSGVGDDRRAGWATAMDRLGLARGPQAGVEDGIETGRRAAAELLGRAEPPEALVCASDSLALGARAAAADAGADVEVVGFDDTPVAAAVDLTSVAQPVEDAARACLELLLTSLDGATAPGEGVLLAAHLVVRRRR